MEDKVKAALGTKRPFNPASPFTLTQGTLRKKMD